jgi:hypothetical protein
MLFQNIPLLPLPLQQPFIVNMCILIQQVFYFLTIRLTKNLKIMKNLCHTANYTEKKIADFRTEKEKKISFKLLVVLVFSLLFGTSTFATIYYVSPGGSNGNSGTSLTASWQTINYAVNYSGLTGGDVIYIRAGTYFEKVIMQKSGAVGNNITVSNYNSEEVIVDGTNITAPSPFYNFAAIFELRGSNVILNGIKAKNARWDKTCSGIVVLGPSVLNVTVQYCVTYNTSSSGIAIHGNTTDYSGCINITIKNCDISEAVCGGYQENLSIADGVDGFTICWNKVHDSKTAPDGPSQNIPLGIDAKTNVRNGKIYNNEVYGLDYAGGIYIDGYDKTAYNIDIYNNSVHNNARSGISIGAEQGGGDYNINVYNNIIYKNNEHGFNINGSNISTPNNIHDVKFYNNTVYGNGYYGLYPNNPNCYNVQIKNNIVSQNVWSNAVNLTSSNKNNITVDYNIFNGVNQAFHPGTESYYGTNAITSDPVLAYPGGNNYRLQSTSPARNAGTSSLAASTDADANGRPLGGAYDMGAYEYVEAAATPVNMLVNPGFESALTTGWTGDWGNSSVITSPTNNSSSKALKVGPSAGGRAQTLTSGFTAGGTYTVSAYCMLSGSGSTGSAYIGVVCKNAAGSRLDLFKSDNITNTGSYVKKTKTFIVPANTTSMEIHVWYDGGTPSVYVDDFAFVSGSTAGSRSVQTFVTLQPVDAAGKTSIYPNPVYSKLLTISLPNYAGNKNMFVYDMAGKLLMSQKLTNVKTQGIKLNKNFLPGNYLVKIIGSDKTFEQIIIVK